MTGEFVTEFWQVPENELYAEDAYGLHRIYCGYGGDGMNLECCRNQAFEPDVSSAAKTIYPPRLFSQPVRGLTQI